MESLCVNDTTPSPSGTTSARWRSNPTLALSIFMLTPKFYSRNSGLEAEFSGTRSGPAEATNRVALEDIYGLRSHHDRRQCFASWFGHTATGYFLVVIGACILCMHLYLRFCALDAVEQFRQSPNIETRSLQ